MARPLLPIDSEQVEKLAAMHCTNVEIANFFGCHVDTISDRFSKELDKGRAAGRMKLRQLQWKAAEKGNVAMMIWLGKQMLGQHDKYELALSHVDNETFLAEAQRRLADASKPTGNT